MNHAVLTKWVRLFLQCIAMSIYAYIVDIGVWPFIIRKHKRITGTKLHGKSFKKEQRPPLPAVLFSPLRYSPLQYIVNTMKKPLE